jgi:hypothetical protein
MYRVLAMYNKLQVVALFQLGERFGRVFLLEAVLLDCWRCLGGKPRTLTQSLPVQQPARKTDRWYMNEMITNGSAP